MILALAFCLCAQTPAARGAPQIEDPAERRAFDQAHKALLADMDLLGLYRGLRAYLATDQELRQAEESYQALLELPSLRGRVDDFEEVLRADSDVRADFDRYFARVRRDPALHDAIERLASAESAADLGRADLAAGFGQLRAHPDMAATFLAGTGRVVPLPATLRPLRDALRRNKDLHTRLRDAWIRLDALAGAREAVYPWWARAYSENGAASRVWRALDTELAPFPSRRRAWEDRQLAWAAHPEGLAWRDQIYARVRRDPALAQTFFDYLHTLRTRPGLEEYAEGAFAAASGPPPAWPPAGTPPSLPAWQPRNPIQRPDAPKTPTLSQPHAPTASGPVRPTVPRPTSPARPTAPEQPQTPAGPATPHF
jgi:hypothetical protein